MSIARITKVVAGVCFLLAAFGATGWPFVPLGLAVWVLGEAG